MNIIFYNKFSRVFLCLIFLFPLLLISEDSATNITISYEELRKGIQEGIDRPDFRTTQYVKKNFQAILAFS